MCRQARKTWGFSALTFEALQVSSQGSVTPVRVNLVQAVESSIEETTV